MDSSLLSLSLLCYCTRQFRVLAFSFSCVVVLRSSSRSFSCSLSLFRVLSCVLSRLLFLFTFFSRDSTFAILPLRVRCALTRVRSSSYTFSFSFSRVYPIVFSLILATLFHAVFSHDSTFAGSPFADVIILIFLVAILM